MDTRSAGAPAAAVADLPSVDRLLNAAAFAPVVQLYGRTQVLAGLRSHLQELRSCARAGRLPHEAVTEVAIAVAVRCQLEQTTRSRLHSVFNLTGTVLHTNLGRAPLPQEAVEAVAEAMTSAVNLEFDLTTGRRGERDRLVESWLCDLSGAEAITVVNNNAAAVLLILSALARKKEVVVSRGELIEIGGSFRLPDIMRQAEARLVEVGTTNRTRLSDYAAALGARSALLLKVHTSNYVIQGFTGSVAVPELAALGHAHAIAVVVDLGSGSLVDLTQWGLPAEPTVRETLRAGADLVCFSGDKLLGGPQCGVIAGRSELIEKLRKHPLKRALRVCKMTLAALEAVLRLYRNPEKLAAQLTALSLLTRSPEAIRAQAERLRPALEQAIGAGYEVQVVPMASQIGSGAAPIAQLPSYALAVRALTRSQSGLQRLEQRLRELPQPILGHLAQKMLWLDLRCLEEAREPAMREMLAKLSSSGAAPLPPRSPQ